MSNDKVAATFHGGDERVDTAAPTRERVEAYEKALGCVFGKRWEALDGCRSHPGEWTRLGCPVAVAAARVEAERVADLMKHLDNVTSTNGWKEHEARFIRAEAKAARLAETLGNMEADREMALHQRDEYHDEVDRLTASVEVISERLRHGDPNRPGSFEDACNHALLHVEATLSGKSRPLALERQKVARLTETLDRVRALADEAQDQYAEGDDDGMLGFNQIYAAIDGPAPADPDGRAGDRR